MSNTPGFFVTLEGPEAAGKSTCKELLVRRFNAKYGVNAVFTREPGGTQIGNELREVVHKLREDHMDSGTELLIYAASRRQLVSQIIKPSLAEGRLVISDRYADSTRAYQIAGRGLKEEVGEFFINFATQEIVPDLTILFDVDPEIALSRKKHGDEWNRMDAQTLDFYKRAMAKYYELAIKEPNRWKFVDASQDIEEVYKEVERTIIKGMTRSGYLERLNIGKERG